MTDLAKNLPDTPAGRQLAWWLAALLRGGEGVSPADAQRFNATLLQRMAPLFDPVAGRGHWAEDAGRLGRPVELALETDEASRTVVVVGTDKDRRFRITVETEGAAPHTISQFKIERVHAFQLETREAGPADAATCADIETRCPIVMGDTSVWFDRGAEHYFDAMRLMEDFTVGLASVDGVPAAISCGAEHTVRVGGVDKRLVTVSHLRVLPEHQRKGLWGAANRALDKYWPRVDGSAAYISVENKGMQHGFANTPDKWPGVVQRLQLDTATLAGPWTGRPATPDDAGRIVQLLNDFHGAEELYVPYTVESLSARLSRASDLYSWERLWLTDDAVVGVWPAGRALRTITDVAGVRTESNPAVVLDYGCAAGQEIQLEALLRAWCAELAAAGMDGLVIYTSPRSPAQKRLIGLARDVADFFMWTPGIPVPEGAEARGIYSDAVYF